MSKQTETMSEVIDRLISAQEREPQTDACPRWPAHPCDVREWAYEMYSINPRAYGECTNCGRAIILFLGRRTPFQFYEEPHWEQYVVQRIRDLPPARVALIGEAAERALRRGGHAQALSRVDGIRPLALVQDIVWEAVQLARTGLAEERKELRAKSESLKRREDALAEREELLSEKHAIEEALRRKRAEIRRLEKTIHRERKKARREPLPVPANFQPVPVPMAGAVLCDTPSTRWLVYALVDPVDPELVRYVGKTGDATGRYNMHCSEMAAPKVREWVNTLRARDAWPVMMCLEACTAETVAGRETHWIHHYHQRHQADLNTSIPTLRLMEGDGAA